MSDRFEYRPAEGCQNIYDSVREEYFDAEEIVEVLNELAAEVELLKKLEAENKRLRANHDKLDKWLEQEIHGAWSSDQDTREGALICVFNKLKKIKKEAKL